jgi:hypothetical protein
MKADTINAVRTHDDSQARASVFQRPGRDIAALASLQILCFLALTGLERRFFIVHLFQLIPYVAIVSLVAVGRQRWAYFVAPLVSLGWLGLAYLAGIPESAVRRLRAFDEIGVQAYLVALLALTTAFLAVLMIVLCRILWVKELSGRGRTLTTFLGSFAMVTAYYAALLHWFWDMIRSG